MNLKNNLNFICRIIFFYLIKINQFKKKFVDEIVNVNNFIA